MIRHVIFFLVVVTLWDQVFLKEPYLTLWKTWMDAVNYAEYYGKIMELLEDILFIESNFKIVSKSITLIESSKLQFSEILNIVYNVSQTVIQNNNSLISEKVKCHDKTSEVGALKSSDFPFFKYVPTTSYDVESTFSQYKNCLSDHRRFTLQSLKIYVFIRLNNRVTYCEIAELLQKNVMFYLTTLATAEVISASPDVPEFNYFKVCQFLISLVQTYLVGRKFAYTSHVN
ncbi:hypothetical protein ANN_02787 [Periplaneta americana]|uniref:Uncharacterized protein n=1 Tax=Periplaneta americana TaxID=6978 RepID=A0ABQ8U0R3_PERAM|nr:hypothetical protein ANN_02787 [Periplaneta americana]